MSLKSVIPILEWLPKYTRRDFKGDILAGITVAVMLVPQGMAYALLAGLPPIYGLYAGIIPLLLYAFFGTSKQLSVGPAALVSLLVLAGIGEFAEPYTSEFVTLAIATALIAGIIQLLLGFFRLGFLVNFLSHPVITGFTSAAAVIIALSQLRNLMGIEIPRSNQVFVILQNATENISQTHWLTLALGVGGFLIMFILRKINKAIPGALITVILGILAVWGFELDVRGVATVGSVPQGLPNFEIPFISSEQAWDLLPLALTICVISFIESLAIAKTIESQHKTYKVLPNQELIALGITKVGGAFFQSFPTTGSFSRSAINNEAGAKTGIASIITAILIALILLFFTPVFYFLPKAILASIIIVAIMGLVDYKEAIHLWKNDRRDFLTMLTTFVITLAVGIQQGVFVGVLLSLALIIYQNSRPHIALLGRIPGTTKYRNVDRYPDAEQWDGIAIVRFDAQMYFGNADYFREFIEDLVIENEEDLKLIILDCSSIHDIDSSSLRVLKDVISFLHVRGIKMYVAGVIGPIRDLFERTNVAKSLGEKSQFLQVNDAVTFYRNLRFGTNKGWTAKALQTNINQESE